MSVGQMAYKRNGYWYRSRRRGSQVVTDYLGTGEFAEAMAEIDRLESLEREMLREAERAERAEIAHMDRLVDEAGEALRLLVRAHLLLVPSTGHDI